MEGLPVFVWSQTVILETVIEEMELWKFWDEPQKSKFHQKMFQLHFSTVFWLLLDFSLFCWQKEFSCFLLSPLPRFCLTSFYALPAFNYFSWTAFCPRDVSNLFLLILQISCNCEYIVSFIFVSLSFSLSMLVMRERKDKCCCRKKTMCRPI